MKMNSIYNVLSIASCVGVVDALNLPTQPSHGAQPGATQPSHGAQPGATQPSHAVPIDISVPPMPVTVKPTLNECGSPCQQKICGETQPTMCHAACESILECPKGMSLDRKINLCVRDAQCSFTAPGSDRDVHGCIGSAGYTWCERLGKCVKEWETPCPALSGADRDEHGCIGSAGYTWCQSLEECIRPFETSCPCLHGMEWTQCGFACGQYPEVCGKGPNNCIKNCAKPQCQCPSGKPWDPIQKLCVKEEDCAPQACTKDLKVCDDGITHVSRDANNDCEFKKCPRALAILCTADAKLCDDRKTWVSRDADNNCEFEACPLVCANDVKVCYGSHVSRDPKNNCEFPACPFVACATDVKQCPGGSYVSRDTKNNCEFEQCPTLVCTLDLKQCPDGSYVSRDTKNNCEFEQCPTQACTLDVKQCHDGSYVSRDGKNNCEFKQCPPAVAILCTADVKECHDGSHVSRDANNKCEFKACP